MNSSSKRSVITFFVKAVAIYGVWYVVYDLWIQPTGALDRWVSIHVAQWAGGVLSILGEEVLVSGRSIWTSPEHGVVVADGCNGLTTIGLFVGFVLAYPGSAVRRVLFIPLGMVVLYLSNVARVAALGYFREHWAAAFDLIHGVGAPAFFYVIVLGLWVVWANYGQGPLRTASAGAQNSTLTTEQSIG